MRGLRWRLRRRTWCSWRRVCFGRVSEAERGCRCGKMANLRWVTKALPIAIAAGVANLVAGVWTATARVLLVRLAHGIGDGRVGRTPPQRLLHGSLCQHLACRDPQWNVLKIRQQQVVKPGGWWWCMIPRPAGRGRFAEPITCQQKSAPPSLTSKLRLVSGFSVSFLHQGITNAVWITYEGAARAPPTRRFAWSSGVRICDFETD